MYWLGLLAFDCNANKLRLVKTITNQINFLMFRFCTGRNVEMGSLFRFKLRGNSCLSAGSDLRALKLAVVTTNLSARTLSCLVSA